MSEAPPRSCAGCAAPVAEAARFCSRCGLSVDAAAHPPRWPELKVALELWVLLILCSGGIGIAMRLTGSQSPTYELTGTVAMAVLVIAFAVSMRRDLSVSLAPRSLLLALVAAGGLVAFIHLYLAGLSLLTIEEVPMLDQYESSQWPMWSAVLMIGVAPAIFEEIAFRGIIYRRLERVGGPREALVVQAAMFSIIHLLPASFISHFVIGLTLGWLRQRTASLLPGMVAHFTYNTTLLLLELA